MTPPHKPSLNACLHPGPALQKLWDILIQQRGYPVVLAGNIKQAFLQIQSTKAREMHFSSTGDQVTCQR